MTFTRRFAARLVALYNTPGGRLAVRRLMALRSEHVTLGRPAAPATWRLREHILVRL